MPIEVPPPFPVEWNDEDEQDLQLAHRILEGKSFGQQLVNLIGAPIEKGIDLMPDKAQGVIVGATDKALKTALGIALMTLDKDRVKASRDLMHKFATAATGGAGGAFGWMALPIELPVSTTIMLRSIADVARSQGEDLNETEARLACVEVFALGNTRKRDDDSTDASYIAIRTLLAQRVSEAAKYVAEKGAIDAASPPLTRFVGQIAERFSITVTQKAGAVMVPVIGAVSGAVVNTYFTGYFQNMALGHFIVRRLERKHGSEPVYARYNALGTGDEPEALLDDQTE
ncbi:MAG: EcsC family protein [Verrucomicrobiota bacterium]